jgi:hypothetical protein
MSLGRWAAVAACCTFFAPAALAQKAAPPATDAKAAANQSQPGPDARDRAWPRLLPSAPEQSRPPVPLEWPAQEIALAQARCNALLKGLDAVAVPEPPIRESIECGTPAPMKLVSIGRNPPVTLSPPPIVTCDLIAALGRWLERDVQPLARRHLGAPVIRIEAMSSYSCRNAYGRPDRRLSEHGRANALDIAAFVTARGQSAFVIADWGPTAREIEAQKAIARAKAAEEAATAPAMAATAAPPSLGSGVTLSIPGLTINVPGLPQAPSELGLAQPNRLGGPKPPIVTVPVPPPAAAVVPDVKTRFLHAAHRSACKIFGTVLGPEANKAHKNHFHVDMAERVKATKICE